MVKFVLKNTVKSTKGKSITRIKQAMLVVGTALTALCSTAASAEAATYYVSSSGTNGDGKSWATAFNELNQIKWCSITAGDTIVLDGGLGNSSRTYKTSLTIPVANVTVTRTKETGHNGVVIIDGAYGQTQPETGIFINATGVKVEGLGWRGISIRNFGVGLHTLGSTSSNALVRNVECMNNEVGASLAGNNSRFDQLVSHDNKTFNVTARHCGAGENVSLTSSWIYSSAEPPRTVTRTRGVQSAAGVASSLTVNRCVIGPGLHTGIEVNDQVIALNCLLINSADCNVAIFASPYRGSYQPMRLSLKNVTSFMTDIPPSFGSHYCIAAAGANAGGPISIDKSIFYGGSVYLNPGGSPIATSTTQFKVTGNTTTLAPTMIDPKFVSNVCAVPVDASFETLKQLDFTLQASSPSQGQGSALSSYKSLTGP